MRFELKGRGEPIPSIALPDPNVSSEFPPQVLAYDNSGMFIPADWIGLGYNRYEVWCVGAAGGRGGGVPGGFRYRGFGNGLSYGGEGGGGGLHRVSGVLSDLPSSVPIAVGRAGTNGIDGNGQDVYALAMHLTYRFGYPSMSTIIRMGYYGSTYANDLNIPGMVDAYGNAIYPYFFIPTDEYLFYLNPTYYPATDAGDGGASTFGGTIARASGGTGGLKSIVFRYYSDDHDRYSQAMSVWPGGNGGQGGVGGRTLAGGGALGSTTVQSAPSWYDDPMEERPWGYPYRSERPLSFTYPQDGKWDGTVGQGGGGGRGGTYQNLDQPPIQYSSGSRSAMASTNEFDDGSPSLSHGTGSDFPPAPPTYLEPTYSWYGKFGNSFERPATSGGHGSFSYGDTSVYGARGTNYAPTFVNQYNLRTVTLEGRIAPGAGGGAKLPGKRLYGSRATGYSPNGFVLIRLFKV